MPCDDANAVTNATEYFVDRFGEGVYSRRTAFLTEGREIRYRDYCAGVDAAAHRLLESGVKRDDRVALMIDDSPEFAYFFFALLKIGAIAVPINVFSRSEHLAFYLSDCRASRLVVERAHTETVISALSSRKEALENIIWVDGDLPVDNDQIPVETALVGPDADAFWLYTSGTTGRPKAVIHRHASTILCARNYAKFILQATQQDVFFSTSKLSFAYGLGNSLLFPLYVGATAILRPGQATPDGVFDYIQHYKPTLFFSVPAVYGHMLKIMEDKKIRFNGVRMCISAGESLPVGIFNAWKQSTGHKIYDGIGSTEALHIFCSNRPGKCKPGTSGKAVAGYQLKIVNESGVCVLPGEAGNLQVKGETIAKGYWNRYTHTRSTFQGEWLSTGDIFRMDEDGYYVFLGRQGDTFKVSGLWVSATEIEHCLLSIEYVVEAAVVAGTGHDGLTVPIAHVVLNEASSLRQDGSLRSRIMETLRSRLSRYKVPERIYLVESLPRTATGKIDRARLRMTESNEPGMLAYG